MDARAIRADTFIRTIEHRMTVDSTNRLAMDLVETTPELPLLVSAGEQTAGRGRGTNTWWSARGALTFTVVVRRTDTSTDLPPYSLVTGLAVRDALQSFLPGQPLSVKWPNDVFLAGRKVCGILVEVPPGRANTLVVGIGINVNNSIDHAPAAIRESAVAMCDMSTSPLAPQDILIAVLRRLETEMEEIDTAALPDRWSEHCALSGSVVTIRRGDRVDSGRCLGIDESGALLLMTNSGELAIASGVVERVE